MPKANKVCLRHTIGTYKRWSTLYFLQEVNYGRRSVPSLGKREMLLLFSPHLGAAIRGKHALESVGERIRADFAGGAEFCDKPFARRYSTTSLFIFLYAHLF